MVSKDSRLRPMDSDGPTAVFVRQLSIRALTVDQPKLVLTVEMMSHLAQQVEAPPGIPLSTPQRVALDLALSGTIDDPQLRIGEAGPVTPLHPPTP